MVGDARTMPAPELGTGSLRRLLVRVPVLARGSTLVLNAALAVVIARQFGATSSGEFYLALAVTTIATMIGRFGTDLWALRVLPTMFRSGQTEDIRREVAWLRRTCGWGSLIGAVAVAVLGVTVALAGRAPVVATAMIVLAAAIPFACAAILDSAVLRSADAIARGAFAETGLTQGLTIVGLLVAAPFIAEGAIGAAACYTGAAIATAIVARAWTRTFVSRGAADRSRPADALPVLAHMMGSTVLFFVLVMSPLLVLGLTAPAREVGLYNAAARVSTFVSLIPTLQSGWVIPRVAAPFGAGDLDLANRVLRRATRQASVVAVAVGAVMLVFAPQVMGVFGGDFTQAVPTVFVLVIGQVLVVLLGNVNPLMAIAGLERRSTIYITVAAVVGVVAMAVLSSAVGLVGVAAAYIAVSLAYAFACTVDLNRRAGLLCFVR